MSLYSGCWRVLFIVLRTLQMALYKRILYLMLVLMRIYFALRPSYLHPDEHFQGPEVVAGNIFSWPAHLTWEFTSATPVRSVAPLYLFYGIPMLAVKWLSSLAGYKVVDPWVVFYALRLTMAAISIFLVDKAVWKLVEPAQYKPTAVLLVASSYVTWTWQCHSFSNALETLLVVWSLVLIQELRRATADNDDTKSALLAALFVVGVFNRVTFATFALIPACTLVFSMLQRPRALAIMALSGATMGLLAIICDTWYYRNTSTSSTALLPRLVITPLNNLKYNTNSDNLALHGIHPFYQHFLVNLPQLLGPAILLLPFTRRSILSLSAYSSAALLSLLPHQEARFLLPSIPLLLASVRLPARRRESWVGAWIVFNLSLGILMGVYHQAGVVPAQLFLQHKPEISIAYWWKTYSPPNWPLGARQPPLTTVDLMGLSSSLLHKSICESARYAPQGHTVLVAPRSATFLDSFSRDNTSNAAIPLKLKEIWSTKTHINLDDMDIGEDGLLQTVERVIGRRGLAIWTVECRSLS